MEAHCMAGEWQRLFFSHIYSPKPLQRSLLPDFEETLKAQNREHALHEDDPEWTPDPEVKEYKSDEYWTFVDDHLVELRQRAKASMPNDPNRFIARCVVISRTAIIIDQHKVFQSCCPARPCDVSRRSQQDHEYRTERLGKTT